MFLNQIKVQITTNACIIGYYTLCSFLIIKLVINQLNIIKMEFNISDFSNEKVDVKNTSKGIAIKKLTPKIYENAEQVRNSILNWDKPLYFGEKSNKELQKTFEDDIKNLELEIERKKMLINLIKRKSVYFID